MSLQPTTLTFDWTPPSGAPVTVMAKVVSSPLTDPHSWVQRFETHNPSGRRVFLSTLDIAYLYDEIARRIDQSILGDRVTRAVQPVPSTT